jgi:hypothetical protein
VEDEWRWLEGNCDPADLGTRSKATPGDMISGSEYQEGRPWMVKPESTWPCKKSFSPAPAEEFRKDMLEGACCVIKGVASQEDGFPEVKKGGLDRLIRVYGYVMAGVHKWKKKREAPGPALINITRLLGGRVIGYPSAECLRSAELFLLEQAQKGMKIPGAKMLTVDTVTEEDINGVKRKLIVIRTRGRNQIKGIYGQVDLPVLTKDHRLE